MTTTLWFARLVWFLRRWKHGRNGKGSYAEKLRWDEKDGCDDIEAMANYLLPLIRMIYSTALL